MAVDRCIGKMLCGQCLAETANYRCTVCGLVTVCSIACGTKHDLLSHDVSAIANEIVPGVWISGVEALKDKRFMGKISAVVTAFPIDRVDEVELSRLLEGKSRLRVPIEDEKDAEIENYFESTAEFISRHVMQGHNVLVHCFKGLSRSVSLVIYYMVTRLGFSSVDLALSHIQKVRPEVHPNSGFLRKLHAATGK